MKYHSQFILQTSLVLTITATALTGCGQHGPGGMGPGGPGGPGGFAMPVVFGEVAQANTVDSADFLAEFSSDASATIRAQVPGRITRVLVQDGQTVAVGQPLFQLDGSQQAAVAKSLEASAVATGKETAVVQDTMKAMQADRQSVVTELTFNQDQLKRYQALLTTSSVSQKDVEQYQTTVNGLQSKLASIDANLKGQKSRIAQVQATVQRDLSAAQGAKTNLSFYTVRAPFSGTLGDISARVGDVADPSMPLTTLTNNQNLELNVAVPADYRTKVHHGSQLQLETYDGHPLGQAQVFFVSPKMDSLSQTTLVKAKVANSTRDSATTFATAQKIKAKLIWGQHPSLLVPVSAVFRMAGQPFVYRVAQANTDKPTEGAPPASKSKGTPPSGLIARLAPVTLGPITGDNYQILSGLQADESIVISGIQKLQDGVPIQNTAPTVKPTTDKPLAAATH
jgi:multidrug efflux pump subunit AcrA (membrane-fusion protein)